MKVFRDNGYTWKESEYKHKNRDDWIGFIRGPCPQGDDDDDVEHCMVQVVVLIILKTGTLLGNPSFCRYNTCIINAGLLNN